MYKRYIKRFLDIICASLALTVFCWLYLIVALLVRVKLGSPVIFKQVRPGMNGARKSLHPPRRRSAAASRIVYFFIFTVN